MNHNDHMIRLLTVGDENPGKVFFPGADSLLPHRFDGHTCALLISQSGNYHAMISC